MYMPVVVYSEDDAVLNHGKELAALGSRALILTGRFSAKNCGALDDTIKVLDGYGITYHIFNRVEENPSTHTVVQAAEEGRNEKADFVIGIGGGSPLDAAKAAAFLMCCGEIKEELLYQCGNDRHLPLALIPTTCGTGSEVTAVSVLTVPELKTKKSISHRIFGDIALVDGKYLKRMPVQILRNTALDALTHMIESRINTGADDFSRMYSDSGMRIWSRNMKYLESGTTEKKVLAELMNASTMGGMAIAQDGTGIPHGLSYSLTYKLQIPHGKAVGYFTAGYLAAADESDRRTVLDILGFSSVEQFQEYYLRMYGKTDVPHEILEQAVDELWKNKKKLSTAPFDVDKDKLEEIAFYTIMHS